MVVKTPNRMRSADSVVAMSPPSEAPIRARRGRQSNETKEQSRRRLLEAALDILDSKGESSLTTGSVTRSAGLAQPSFYVHFSNMDELLAAMLDEFFEGWWQAAVEARAIARANNDPERYLDTWRVPIQGLLSEPRLFRILLRNRHDPRTQLGAWSAKWFADHRSEFVADLRSLGLPHKTAAEKRRLEMIADGVLTLTTELVEGHLQGRYPSVEEVIDVLNEFSIGYLRGRSNSPRRRSVSPKA